MDAAWVYATAYGARCEHSDAQLVSRVQKHRSPTAATVACSRATATSYSREATPQVSSVGAGGSPLSSASF